MKYKVGDIVRTTKDLDEYGAELFPIGTVGIITNIDEKIETGLHYKVETENDYWFYSEDMLELVSIEKTYEQGLEDAWELVNKIYKMKNTERREIFDKHEFLADVLDNFTPQEALAKLKAYEDRIEVGDVVEITHCDEKFKGLVLDILDEISFVLLTENGMVESYIDERVKKTGKRIDITSILELISEV